MIILCKIMEGYLQECERDNLYDFRYYYLKYALFRPGRFGKYYWEDFDNKPYEFVAMYAERNVSTNMYQPFLKEIDPGHISKDDYGWYLYILTRDIMCRVKIMLCQI